jgi:hypothetical protein
MAEIDEELPPSETTVESEAMPARILAGSRRHFDRRRRLPGPARRALFSDLASSHWAMSDLWRTLQEPGIHLGRVPREIWGYLASHAAIEKRGAVSLL